jgi:hypothetical protein
MRVYIPLSVSTGVNRLLTRYPPVQNSSKTPVKLVRDQLPYDYIDFYFQLSYHVVSSAGLPHSLWLMEQPDSDVAIAGEAQQSRSSPKHQS